MKVRNRYLVIVAAAWVPCFALAAAFCAFAIRPQVQRDRELRTELAEAKSLYAVAQEAAKKDDQVRMAANVEELHERVFDFATRLEAAPDLAFEIAQLATVAGVESFAMKPRNRQGLDSLPDCDRIGEKRIDVSFSSPFHGFATLLNSLERHRPVLFVESFAIRHSRAQPSQAEAHMELAVLIEKPQGS
jgi:hypothetical protein